MTTKPTIKEEGPRFRMSQFNLQGSSIADELGTPSGHLNVESAVDMLVDTRKSVKLLTKIIIGLIVYSILLTIAIFGVSIAAAEIAKDTTIDPSTGFVYAKHGQDHPIMRTAEAVESVETQSIHGMSNKDLADLKSVSFLDGALMFQVKGFGSTEEKTMLFVEGGALTFDDIGLVDVTGDLLADTFSSVGEGRKLQSGDPVVVIIAKKDGGNDKDGETVTAAADGTTQSPPPEDNPLSPLTGDNVSPPPPPQTETENDDTPLSEAPVVTPRGNRPPSTGGDDD